MERHLGESRVNMTLNWATWEDREGKRGEPDTVARRPKVQKGRVTKMSGLYREESLGEGQPSPWAGEFRVEGSSGV